MAATGSGQAPPPRLDLERARRLGHRVASVTPAPATGGRVQPYREVNGWKHSQHDQMLLRGEKNFWAEKSLIESSNQQLKATGHFGSLVTLQPGTEGTYGERRIYKVVPSLDVESHGRLVGDRPHTFHSDLPEKQQEGQPLQIWADCRRASETVTGSSPDYSHQDRQVWTPGGEGPVLKPPSRTSLPYDTGNLSSNTSSGRLSWQVYESHMKPFVDARDKKAIFSVEILKRNFPGIKGWSKVQEKVDASPEDVFIAWKLFDSLKPNGKEEFTAFAGINERARPGVGDSYSMITEYDMPGFDYDENPWAFHWGGVIMADGSDRVTLENYSVSQEQKANDRWQFSMYGTEESEQTFYHRHLSSGHHGNRATALTVVTEGTSPALRDFLAEVGNLARKVGDEETFSAAWAELRKSLGSLDQGNLSDNQTDALRWGLGQAKEAKVRHQRNLALETSYQRSRDLYGQLPKTHPERGTLRERGGQFSRQRKGLPADQRSEDEISRLEAAASGFLESLVAAIVGPPLEAVVNAVGSAGFNIAEKGFQAAWESLQPAERDLAPARNADGRMKELSAAHETLVGLSERVEALAETVGTSKFEGKQGAIDYLLANIPDEFQKHPVHTAAAEQNQQHTTIHQTLGYLDERVRAQAEAVGTPQFDSAQGAINYLLLDIPGEYRGGPAYVEVKDEASRLVKSHAAIQKLEVDLEALEAAVGNKAQWEKQAETLQQTYKSIDERFRKLQPVVAARKRAQHLHTLHKEKIT